jgi:hypothetical protein
VKSLARWERPKGESRSKTERIKVKNGACPNAGERSIKKVRGRHVGVENGRILMRSKSILLVLRARAGLTKYIFFFLD